MRGKIQQHRLARERIEADVNSLVQIHLQLEDPMDAAIWIRPNESAIWIVEILPWFPDDDYVHQPVVFHPTNAVPRKVKLIAGNLASLKKAVIRLRNFPRWISDGIVVHDQRGVGKRLVTYSKKHGGHIR